MTAYLPGSRSLDLAELKDGDLVSVGSVGAGLSERAADAIKAQIAAQGFAMIEVKYRGRTPSGNLRRQSALNSTPDETSGAADFQGLTLSKMAETQSRI